MTSNSNGRSPSMCAGTSNLTVYVPRPGSQAAALLAPRSAVVGDGGQASDGHVVCHFEGRIYNQAGMERFYDRLCHAGDRLGARYPTRAMSSFAVHDLVPVARFDARRQVVTEVIDAAALADWCGETADDVVGVRLPSGKATWQAAAPLGQPPSRRLGRHSDGSGHWWFRTQAGQVIEFVSADNGANVYDFGDPAISGLLADLSDVEHRLVFG